MRFEGEFTTRKKKTKTKSLWHGKHAEGSVGYRPKVVHSATPNEHIHVVRLYRVEVSHAGKFLWMCFPLTCLGALKLAFENRGEKKIALLGNSNSWSSKKLPFTTPVAQMFSANSMWSRAISSHNRIFCFRWRLKLLKELSAKIYADSARVLVNFARGVETAQGATTKNNACSSAYDWRTIENNLSN